MTGPAIRAVARHDWRRRWRTLMVLGLVAGVLGGLVISTVALARRTASAPERLFAAVAPGDAEVQIFGDPALAATVSELPGVDGAWPARLAVARIEGPAVVYMGVAAGPRPPVGMFEPVVLEGRAPDPDDPHEVALGEEAAAALGLGPGDTLGLDLLTAEEVTQFDVGFGEPDGPSLEVTIAGVMRLPDGVLGSSPVLGTPAFAGRYGEYAAGTYVHVALDRGGAGYDDYAAAIETAMAAIPPEPGAEEFAPVAVAPLVAGTEEAARSARVLVGGLVVAALVSVAAGLFALGQAMARHHAASAADQLVEAALGMTRSERVVARVVPALVTASVAAVVATSVAMAAAGVEPPGATGAQEPHPGRLVDAGLIGLGAAVLGLAILSLAALTASRAGSSATGADAGGMSRSSGPFRWRSGWGLAGATFALSAGRGGRAVPVRSAIVGSVLAVAGLVAGLTFGATLERLEATPQRWGWSGDLMVIDVTDEITERLAADPRIGDLTALRTTDAEMDGRQLTAVSTEPLRGSMGWTIIEGRDVSADDEVVVGTRLARTLGLRLGDTVQLADGPATVVGTGVGHDANGDGLGRAILLSKDRLGAAAVYQDFRELLVRAAPGVDGAALADDLGREYELQRREPPAEVRELAELGLLPGLLGAFLGALGILALIHALALTAHRRAGDLAVLQALGATPAQAALAIVAMALTTAAIGVVVGVPLGWATARLVWGEVARTIGVAPDLVVPLSVALVAAGALVAAIAAAALPAALATRLRPAHQLRRE